MQYQHLLAISRFLSPASAFTLPADERAFQSSYRRGGYGFAVAVMLVGTMMALGFLTVDLLSPNEDTDGTSLQVLRTVIAAACGSSFLAMVFAPDWSIRNHRYTVFLPAFVALSSLCLLLFLPRSELISPVNFGRSTLSLIIAFWLISAFCRLPLRQIMMMSLTASIVNLVGLQQLGLTYLPYFAFDLFVVNLTVWTLTIQIEKRERLLWLQSDNARKRSRHTPKDSARPLIEADLPTSRVLLTGVFNELKQVFGPQAVRRGVDLRFTRLTTQARPTRTNESALFEIMSQLITNAISYSSIRPASGAAVMVGVATIADEVRIDIIDNGIGIDPANHTRIFEEHFRVQEVAGKLSGDGRGLSIVESLVQRLPEHRLRLHSVPGSGTRIRIYLPLI